MAGKKASKTGRLTVLRAVDVPLQEVSGICLRRGPHGEIAIVAVGDRAAKLAWAYFRSGEAESPEWLTANIAQLPGSRMSEEDAQIEAVCADGAGRVLLLQESPARAELVDPETRLVVASIELVVEGDSELARSWNDPDGSRGEGAVLLPGGHLLVAKEKHSAALVEFGPARARSRGFVQGGALACGARWPIENGDHRYVPLAVWLPDKSLNKVCEDFSDLEVGPDERLYLLSDKSATIARLDDLAPGGGTARHTASWRLGDVDGKPEGLSFSATGRAIVALDKRKARNNLVLLAPAIATPSEHATRSS